MTKEEIEAKMREAGLPNPRVMPHRALDKTHHYNLYCGEDARRMASVPRGPRNDADVAKAIAQLNG